MADANLNQLWARALVEELQRGGVQAAVVCPGSRLAPLALACAERLRTWSVIDERSAAFFALGMAKESGRPVVLVATSGTAGANFYPAVIEAFHSHVPMLILTADRPPELHGWGAPQTIRQQALFGSFVRDFADLGVPEAQPRSVLHLRALAAHALALAARAPRGPVHLNAPFREPLAPTLDAEFRPEALGPLAGSGRGKDPLVDFAPPTRVANQGAMDELKRRLDSTEKGIIVLGPRDLPDGLATAALGLGQAYGYPVLADACSQARYGRGAPPIALYDALLRHGPFADVHRPQCILRFGGGLTSKTLQAWIDGSAAWTVLFSEEGALFDPSHAAAQVIEGEPVAACRLLAQGVAARRGAWLHSFEEAERRARAALEAAFGGADELSEPRVARELVAALPENANLFVSNSMPVRDLDAFAVDAASVRVLANRGVNGIDGIVSSALGAAVSSGKPTALLAGDLAVLHDLGGWVTAYRHRLSLAVVVVNNDGGGIFSFLPLGQHPEHFERLFATPHGLDFERVAALFDARLARPRSVREFSGAVRSALEGGLHLIEVRVDRQQNVAMHQRLYARVAEAIGGGPWA